MTERCHYVWGRIYSAQQRADLTAWARAGAEGSPPHKRPRGDEEWLFIPGCYAGMLDPGTCTCGTLQGRLEAAQAEVGKLRRELEQWRRRLTPSVRNQATWAALRAVGYDKARLVKRCAARRVSAARRAGPPGKRHSAAPEDY